MQRGRATLHIAWSLVLELPCIISISLKSRYDLHLMFGLERKTLVSEYSVGARERGMG